MGYCFFDTSALVKRYYRETGTEFVDELVEDDERTVVITSLAVIEATSAFRRKYSANEISEHEMTSLVASFFDESLSDFVVVPMDDVSIERAFDLILEDDLRTLDSLQLSAALAFDEPPGELTFVSADDELIDVADSRELTALNPTEEVAS